MAANSTPIDQEDASAAEAATLSSLYSFLALTMRYPDPAFCNDQFLDAMDSLLASLEWQTELDEFRAWRGATIDHLDDLRTEYTRLFITAALRATIPPYASVYMDGDGTLSRTFSENPLNTTPSVPAWTPPPTARDTEDAPAMIPPQTMAPYKPPVVEPIPTAADAPDAPSFVPPS